MHRARSLLLVFILLYTVLPQVSFALLPPDLLFSVGSQVVQIFALVALVIGGTISSMLIAFRQFFSLSNQLLWWIIGVVVVVLLCSVGGVYLYEVRTQNELYRAEVERLAERIEEQKEQMAGMVTRSDYQKVRALLTGEEYGSELEADEHTPLYSGQFLSDVVTLYTDQLDEPFSLELSMNRLTEAPDLYTQYSFLSGTVMGQVVDAYDSIYATTTEILPNAFITSFTRDDASDLSTRGAYEGVVLVNEKPLTFSISGVSGDFITRDHPNYTRYQSVGTGLVTYNGQTFEVEALVEGSHAMDAGEYVFFPEYNDVHVVTRQFVLWDELGTFYMIDHSEVTPFIREYPSHSWLLFKDGATGVTKKGFNAAVEDVVDTRGSLGWNVDALELYGARFELFETGTYSGETEDGLTSMVTGVVRDNSGERTVSGILNRVH